MKPVNLIPPEERRGDHAPLRAGGLSYVVIGAIAAALIAVVALVLTQNSITERENEIAQLEVAEQAATQRAQALAPYAEFASLQQQRETTITSLADSRFDWERVLRELAIVIPSGVTLVMLEASTTGAGEEVSTGDSSGAPSLMMGGCAPNHDVVAEFVAALEDIDGVTRVGLQDSVARGNASESAATETQACGTDPEIADFSLTAVFDGVTAAPEPTAPEAGAAPAPADPAATQPAPAGENSAQEQVQEANQAVDVVAGTAR
jgi:Tfp pilus assembly protein PilN